MNIQDQPQDVLVAALAKSDQDLASFSFTIRSIVPELLRRIDEANAKAAVTLESVLAWVENAATLDEMKQVRDAVLLAIPDETAPAVPAEPKPPTVDPGTEGRDRIDGATPSRTVVLKPGDNVMEKLGGRITDTRVIVKGTVGAIRIGGKNGLKMEGGPAEILGFGTVQGVKLDGDPKGQLYLGDALTVTPEAKPDGTSMGDFAPIRGMGSMPNLHLVLDEVVLDAPAEWDGYDGFGMKWGMLLDGTRLTMLNVTSAPAREHLFYGHNMLDVWCEDVENELREIVGKDGITRPLGNGRTLLQCTNRVPRGDRLPKSMYALGGLPSAGSIVFRDCIARGVGWEGLLDKINPAGSLDPLNYGKGGGAAFTVAGHTGPLVRMEGCRTEWTYAAGIEVYVDYSSALKTQTVNPHGYRCWMFDEFDGFPLDPTRELRNPATSWATHRFELVGYKQDREGSRKAVSVAGVREFMHDGMPGLSFRTDYQSGVRKIETIEVTS